MKEKTDMMRFWVESYYDYQKQRIQTGNRIGSIVIRKLDPEGWQKKKEDKGERSMGVEYNFDEVKEKYQANKTLFTPEEIAEVDKMFIFMDDAEKIEHMLDKEIKVLVQSEPIYANWLKDVRGIGHILSAGLICWIGEIGRFNTVSKLWAYSGLHVVDGQAARRVKGQKGNWNNRLKTHCWKIGESFVKQSAAKCVYREVYDKCKTKDKEKHPEVVEVEGSKRKSYTPGHLHMRAKRVATKVFLEHLWVKWRELEGLPVTRPYCEAYLGHKAVPAP